MMYLIVVVEGQTEEVFINTTLKPHLERWGQVYTSATIVGKAVAQQRGHGSRGGGHYRHWKRDIERILKSDPRSNLVVTTLFDLYGLPQDFPGLTEHGSDTDSVRRCDALEAALGRDIGTQHTRFIPYIQRHEFEALVLAALGSLHDLMDDDALPGIEMLEDELSELSPEDVNDGRSTAPSKRLLHNVPGYSKNLHGPLAIEDAGLEHVRRKCPRLHAWLEKLEMVSLRFK